MLHTYAPISEFHDFNEEIGGPKKLHVFHEIFILSFTNQAPNFFKGF